MLVPNIFNYATKELSQDAMIAWLFACLHSEDENIRNIGANFVRFILKDYSITNADIDIESESPRLQYYRMDVFCVIKVKNEIIPIVFEDKTNTFLHDNQLSNYCEKVLWWQRGKKNPWLEDLKEDFNCQNNDSVKWGNTYYFLFKTGFMSGYEKLFFEGEKQKVSDKYNSETQKKLQINQIELQSMIKFLQEQTNVYLLPDYLNYLKELKRIQDFCVQNWNSNNYFEVEKALSTKAGCVLLFEEIFGNKVEIEYNHQNWCQTTIYPAVSAENRTDEIIDYKIKLNKYKNGYALQLLQYRNEKKLKKKEYELKYEEGKKFLKISEEIINRIIKENNVFLGYEDLIEYGNKVDVDKGFNENFIFMMYLNKRPINEICTFFRAFVAEFIKTLSNESKLK